MKKNDSVKRGVLGFFLGLAVIVPGISGSTIAIIFKLYEKILEAIANIFKKFKTSFMFLLPIVIGAVVGVLAGFFSIQKLLEILPFAIVALFGGLMLGSMPSLKDEIEVNKEEIKTKNKNLKGIILFTIGILIPLLLCLFSILGSKNQASLDIDFLHIVIYLILGFVVALTQFIPGCSATATLMAVGYFLPIMNSVHITFWKDSPKVFVVYVILVVGFLIGCLVISKTITKLLEKYKRNMFFLFIGLSIGSVCAMFCNSDMIEIYKGWSKDGIEVLDLTLGIVLFFVGLAFSYGFLLYSRKKNKKNEDGLQKILDSNNNLNDEILNEEVNNIEEFNGESSNQQKNT